MCNHAWTTSGPPAAAHGARVRPGRLLHVRAGAGGRVRLPGPEVARRPRQLGAGRGRTSRGVSGTASATSRPSGGSSRPGCAARVSGLSSSRSGRARRPSRWPHCSTASSIQASCASMARIASMHRPNVTARTTIPVDTAGRRWRRASSGSPRRCRVPRRAVEGELRGDHERGSGDQDREEPAAVHIGARDRVVRQGVRARGGRAMSGYPRPPVCCSRPVREGERT